MRTHHTFGVIVAVILIGVGVKFFFFSVPAAEAYINAAESYSMSVPQMQIDQSNRKAIPAQKMHDMSVVFSDSD